MSCPSVKVWSHESVKDTVKLPQNKILGNFFIIKIARPKRKYFYTVRDIISSEQLRKLEKIKPFGQS